MMDFPNFSTEDLAAIKAVIEKSLKRELYSEQCDELFSFIVGNAHAYVFSSRPTEEASVKDLRDSVAAAQALRASINTWGERIPSGAYIGFMTEHGSGDMGEDMELAQLHFKKWSDGLDKLIAGLEREISFRPQKRGRPTLISRNVFWGMLEYCWVRFGGKGPGKIGDEWAGGIIDFISACSRPVMNTDEITPGKIGEFLKSQKKDPVFKFERD